MPTVLLIRHGENDYVKKGRLAGRLPGVHLNARGQAQAAALAAALKDLRLAAVYSSPLERAVQTAQPLAAARKLPIVKCKGLLESDLGEWQGKLLKTLQRDKRWATLQNKPSLFRFPGGEGMLEQQARLVAEIEALCAMHKPKDAIACVLHADPIKLIIAHYAGMPLDQFQRLSIATASVSTLHIQPGRAMLERLNWVAPEL
ncbi:MAG: histidine phosphatase family protein [Anaerolineales bacterium]|nr:MAG: histidine phosphatase family protein [Anaerolineales bacterium]